MTKSALMLTAFILSMSVVGCFSSSSVIKGTVVMRMPNEAHINIGINDGIQVGDTLTVFRNDPHAGVRNTRVGLVRVVKLLDKDYSVVEVLKGTLYERDIVEKGAR